MSKTFNDWKAQAATLRIEGRAFIGGAYVAAADGAVFDCISPVDGAVLCQVARCGAADVECAVSSARQAFEAGVWADKTTRERKAVLLRWAQLLLQHSEELALLETLDSGKPIRDTLNSDLPNALYCLEWYAEAIDKRNDEAVPCGSNFLALVRREAMGVVAAIVPWNYPLLMAAWKFAPALAVGNSLILKPSERSPLTALRIAQLAKEAGIPDGVFNVLPGMGDVGAALSAHADVDCVAFTGSGPTGRRILKAAADSNLKRVWLELGGKSPNIIMADCPDLERAAQSAAAAIFSNMGEVCSAGSRLLVHRSLRSRFVAMVAAEAKNYQPGHPLDPDTSMGALIDKAHLERVLAYIEAGSKETDLLLGGKAQTACQGGYYMEPTIFLDASKRATVGREEVFGPVLTVVEFDSPEEALALANRSEYGLAAAVWTADQALAQHMARKLKAGTVWINCYDDLVDMNFPFGGYKQSGNGRDLSLHALDKYTELKTCLQRLS